MVTTVEQARNELRKRAAIQELQRRETSPQQQGLGQRILSDLQQREQTIVEAKAATAAGEQTRLEGAAQQFAQPFLAGADIIGETATSAFRALPDPIEQGLRGAGSAALQTLGKLPSAAGGTIGEGLPGELQQVSQFIEDRPRLRRNLGVLEATTLASPLKFPGTQLLRRGADIVEEGVSRGTKSLTKISKDQASQQKSKFAADLVAPIETTKFLEEASASGRLLEEGVRRKNVVQPTPREINSSSIVEQLDIDPNRSFTHNNNIVLKDIDTRAKALIKELDSLKVTFPKREIKARLTAKAEGLVGNPFLVGNPQLTVEKVKNLMNDVIDSNLSTPAGLLKARKEIDSELKRQTLTKSGSTIFDSTADKAVNQAIRDLRQEINAFIAEKAPTVNVRQSLGEQSLLFDARDTIAAKAGKEGRSAMGRLIQEVSDKKRINVRFLGTGLAAGETATSRFVSALGGPKAKENLARLLRATDQAIKLEKDAGVIRQLRTDKAIVLELFKQEKE